MHMSLLTYIFSVKLLKKELCEEQILTEWNMLILWSFFSCNAGMSHNERNFLTFVFISLVCKQIKLYTSKPHYFTQLLCILNWEIKITFACTRSIRNWSSHQSFLHKSKKIDFSSGFFFLYVHVTAYVLLVTLIQTDKMIFFLLK